MQSLAQIPTRGILTEEVRREPAPAVWIWLLCLSHAALMIPYQTWFVPWGYANGVFPVRPILYMLALGGANMVLAFLRGPDLTRTTLFIILFVGIQALDAAVLKRYVMTTDHGSFVTGIYSVLFVIVCAALTLGVCRKTSLLPVKITSAGTVIVCSGMVLLEWVGFGSFTNVDGRPSGWVGDPNNACIMITLMLGVWLIISEDFWPNMGLIGLSGAAVFLTLSRSGFLVFALMVAAYVALNPRYMSRFIVMGLAMIPVVSVAVGLILAKGSEGGRQDENVRNRVMAIFEGDLDKMGSGERMKDLSDGMDAVSQRPMFGYGTGAGFTEWQPHNQLVVTWLDMGILGPLCLLVLFGILIVKCVLVRFRTIYAVIPLLLYVPFSQILLETYAWWYAVLAALQFSSTRFWSFRLLRDSSVLTERLSSHHAGNSTHHL